MNCCEIEFCQINLMKCFTATSDVLSVHIIRMINFLSRNTQNCTFALIHFAIDLHIYVSREFSDYRKWMFIEIKVFDKVFLRSTVSGTRFLWTYSWGDNMIQRYYYSISFIVLSGWCLAWKTRTEKTKKENLIKCQDLSYQEHLSLPKILGCTVVLPATTSELLNKTITSTHKQKRNYLRINHFFSSLG